MTIITKGLSAWATTWASESLAGAIRGRTPDELHEKLSAEVADATVLGAKALVGNKLDLRATVDSVDTHMVNGLLPKLAPRNQSRSWWTPSMLSR